MLTNDKLKEIFSLKNIWEFTETVVDNFNPFIGSIMDNIGNVIFDDDSEYTSLHDSCPIMFELFEDKEIDSIRVFKRVIELLPRPNDEVKTIKDVEDAIIQLDNPGEYLSAINTMLKYFK